MKTVNFSDYKVNRGASWIHGACINTTNISKCSYNNKPPNDTNSMLELAYKYNISFTITNHDDIMILDPGGTEHNTTNTDNLYHKWEETQECIEHILVNITKGKLDEMSYFAALYLCGWKQPLTNIKKTVEWTEFPFGMFFL